MHTATLYNTRVHDTMTYTEPLAYHRSSWHPLARRTGLANALGWHKATRSTAAAHTRTALSVASFATLDSDPSWLGKCRSKLGAVGVSELHGDLKSPRSIRLACCQFVLVLAGS